MNRFGGCLLVAFLVLTFSTGVAWAQSSAQILGTVKDPSGAVMPGVEISVTQTATGAKRSTVSNETGSYVLPSLPIGPYVLEAALPGFKTYVQTGIVLQIDDSPIVNVVLQVGQVSEQVEVQANAALVETTRTAIGQVVTNRQIAELPLNGRDPHELIFLAGMATTPQTTPGAGSMNSIRNYPTVVVAVAGGNGDGVSYLLDGTIWQDPYNSLSMPLPFPDALQEFKVDTSAMQAQHGFHATAAVNAVTRSGTNEFHGNLFEFVRNYKLNARSAFAAKRDTYKRNQFGGVIGGPIKKDKLFFFVGYQRTSLRSDGVQNTAFVPTPAMLNGDFTGIASAGCNNGVARTLPASLGFTDNKIDPSRFDKVAVAIAKTFPVSNDPCGRTLYGLVANQDEDQLVSKIDYTINSKSSFFGRFMMGKLNTGSTFDGTNPLSIQSYGYKDLAYGLNIGHTYLIGANIVNSLRIGANRTNVAKIDDTYKSWTDFGANVTELAGKMVSINAGNQFMVGGGAASPGAQHNGPMPSLLNDVSWIKGTHQIGFGGGIYQQRLNYWSGVNAVGAATFDGSRTGQGMILLDFMMGLPTTFNQGTAYGYYTRQFYDSLYVQDSWKVHPRLTLNYGLRWEPYLSPYNDDGENEHFDLEAFRQGVRTTVFANAPAGLFFPGDPQYTSGKYFNGPRWAKFYPRVGLAWDPEGKGRMTIRAAYGMYGDRAMMLAGTQVYFSAPFGNLLSNSGANLTDPWVAAGGNPMPRLSAMQGIGVYDKNIPFFNNGNYVTTKMSDFDPVYMNQWNLNIQRQFGQNWLVTANYVGNNTIHMITSQNINPAVYFPTQTFTGAANNVPTCTLPNGTVITGAAGTAQCSTVQNQQSRRVLNFVNPTEARFYASVGQLDDGGTSTYNALNLSVQKRISSGLSGQANYTWSHCISDVYADNPTAAGVSVPGNRGQYRGNCSGIDRRQLFGMSVVATTPKFSNRTLSLLASDWQFAPILSIASAQFFSVWAGTDQALTTVPNQPVNIIDPANIYPQKKTAANWINKAAFAPAAPGTYGNAGYNSFKGPGTFQLNMAVSRTFAIRERQSIQVRAEAFNLPNHVNLTTPGGAGPGGLGRALTYTSSNFGQITSDISGNSGLQAGDYRIVQFALKLIF